VNSTTKGEEDSPHHEKNQIIMIQGGNDNVMGREVNKDIVYNIIN